MKTTKTGLMSFINFLIFENKNLKNGISELKVKYKQIFEENQMLKAEKNKLKVKLRNILNEK